MQANRAISNREVAFRKALWAAGARGYRVQTSLPGRPDIVFPALRLAIFVNGCFWHLCPRCKLPQPRANEDFWKNKLEANRRRDARVRGELEALGWEVRVVWEHEIRPDPRPRAIELAQQLLLASSREVHCGRPGTSSRVAARPDPRCANGEA